MRAFSLQVGVTTGQDGAPGPAAIISADGLMHDNILLIEDEEALRMTLGDRLRNEGYTVDWAPDGDAGFEKATLLPFDLILLDVMLPGKNGLDVCKDIRRAGLITPILMLTAL